MKRVFLTFNTMFWSLFGLGDDNKVLLAPFRNSLTETFGTFLYGCYHIASIIVLLNMLIASMTQSFERILVNTQSY
jgi:transient receptor potential cation channel subfamily C member 4